MFDKPIVSIRNLYHTFDKNPSQSHILININLDIYPGEIVLLTGPSGSGKTTLLTLIGALRTVQNASLQVLNRELYNLANQELVTIRNSIGFIFQTHNLMESMTAQQNVGLALRLHQDIPIYERAAMSIKILESVGLGNYLHSYPKNLSVGQKQRVAIARALVSKPALILADEPTASLDSKSGQVIKKIIQNLAREQKTTILLVTHDTRIFDIADRILFIEDGQLVEKPVTVAT